MSIAAMPAEFDADWAELLAKPFPASSAAIPASIHRPCHRQRHRRHPEPMRGRPSCEQQAAPDELLA